MRAVIYLRQSKDTKMHTADEGLAIARQAKDCERLCADRGWTVVATFTDNDISASNGKHRPGYEQILKMVDAKEVDVVVAWAVDRLTRRISDLEDIISRCETAGVRVATVSGDLDLSTDAGRLVGRILASVARGEVERKSARQSRAGLQAAESGKAPARLGFGFTKDGHHPEQASDLVELYGLVLAGMSMLAATRWLNARGHRTTTGKVWDRSSCRQMLLNGRNCGQRIYHGQVVAKGDWEPIVSEEVWLAAKAMIDDPTRKAGRSNARRWLGGGLFLCHCGARVRVNYSQHTTRVYQCQKSAHLSRNGAPIDVVVEERIVAHLRDSARLADLLAPDNSADVKRLRVEATALRTRLDQLAADYADGLVTGRQLQIATSRIEESLAAVEQELADAGRGNWLAPLLNAADPGQRWLDSDLATRQRVLDALATVTILPGSKGRAPFDPDSVQVTWKH